MRIPKPNRIVLVIGDIHEPFSLDDYIHFCKDVEKQFNCNEVVMIGDLIDNAATTFHSTDPDGLSAGDELARAKLRIKMWEQYFPKVKVCIGNHDKRPARVAKEAKISKEWIKGYKEVLDVDDWQFANEHVIDGVLYRHGDKKKAKDVALYKGMSVVQGHFHTEFSIDYMKQDLWGMQVGCGIDASSYAFDYANSHLKSPIIGCGVVFNRRPILCPYVH